MISCALVVKLARRWTTPAWAYVIAALFASTPVVQLVTGSLFVENVWGALVAGAVYALIESEGVLAAALMGAATATKLIAAGFAVPVLAIVAWMGFKDRKPKTVLAAAAVFTALAAPPYVFAYAKSGNPIFPFANATFRSADYDATKSFADPRYDNVHPGWDVLYRMTFQSAEYIEGDGGALGFQYFLLLLPAVILVRRRDQAIVMGVALAGSALVLAGAPNMRYLYAAMPLASLAIAWTPWTALAPVLIVLNLWFLPAAGFYHNDFAFFDKSKKEAYLARQAPARLLIEKINHWAPGEPVAFFATDAIAGLDGPAFVDTWHSENYWKPVREALHATDVAAELKKRHIRYVIAPKDRVSQFETIHAFLLRWLDVLPNSAVGNRSLYTLRETELPLERDTTAMLAGLHDDTEQRVEYSGQWLHDPQFSQPVKGTVSYADKPGDFLRIWFEGRALTYIFTKAPNRGIGEIWLDDKFVRRVNQYADEVTWQSSVRIDGFVPGVHKFEIRVTGAKDKRASGAFVDFDALRVE
ncbi:MAG: GlyGly-CTERM sorting domain-containing protein [Acidobacteriota bacterium]